ncbi:hypothetical protein [Roseibium sp.]|uniref:VHL beta domain-containing protein n=1 Tax=Roseibium sp. TaxID=1936156 RepID=UPI003A9795DE
MPRPAVGLIPAALAGLAHGILLFSYSAANAQTAPETLRINVEPAKPGIRSITLNKKYRPIISRDDAGVVIDTIGSDTGLPPCEVQLEVTLENSRVLHRSADICSGGTLIVDVANDGKPGSARIVGTPGAVSAPQTPSAPTARETGELPRTLPQTETTPIDQPLGQDLTPLADGVDGIVPQPETGDGLLKPLETVDIDGNSQPGLAGQEIGPGGDALGGNPTGQSEFLVSPSENRVWATQTSFGANSRADLTHGVPETDDIDFRAACFGQSGQATVVFSQTSAAITEGVTEAVRVSAGSFSTTYSAIGGSTNNQYGQSFPQIVLPMTDPLWQALIAESELTVQVQGTPAYTVSLKGSAQPVRLFAATCAQPQTIIGEDSGLIGTAPVVANGADVSCGEVGRIRSLDGNRPGQIVFRNNSREAVNVHWIDYNGGERAYARLEPGQMLDQQTYVSHAWIVRSVTGQCLGIYVTRTPYREVLISGGARSRPEFQPQSQPFGLPAQTPPAGPVPPGNIGINGSADFGSPRSSVNAEVVNYLCTAGIDLQVTFSSDGASATIAEMGMGVVTLPRRGGNSSFQYESEGYRLSGQKQNATWTRPGLRDVFCAMR